MKRNLWIGMIVVVAIVAVVEGVLLLGLHRPSQTADDGPAQFQLLESPFTTSRMASSKASSSSTPSPPAAGTVRSDDPFAELDRIRREMDARMQETMQRIQAGHAGSGIVLSVPGNTQSISDFAVEEQPNRYICTIEIQGVDEDSIGVMVEDNILSVSGKRTVEQTHEQQGKIVAHIRQTERFTRPIPLPGPVEAPCIRTSFKDGVLTIDAPKSPTP